MFRFMNETSYYPDNYRRYLTDMFENRSLRNPSYSMRAYARDLGMGTSTLLEVLQGKYGLSKARIDKVAKNLNLTEVQTEHFNDLIIRDHSRNIQEREEAAERIQLRLKSSMQTITQDGFRAISDWYHMALLELMAMSNFQSDTAWMSKKLNLPELTIKEALDRLERLDLVIKTDKGFELTDDFSAIGDDTPSEIIRKFHRQILEKAMFALDCQPTNKRENSSTIFAINKEDIPKAKKKLVKFRREFSGLLSKTPEKNDVYCLSMQFFSLINQEGQI